MSPDTSSIRHSRAHLGAAVATALLGLLLLLTPLGSGLVRRSYDAPLATRPPVRRNEVVIVYMDHDSQLRLGQPSIMAWDRGLHADLLTKLKQHGAAAVVFDVAFTAYNTNRPEGDRRLVDAARAHGKVLSAAFVTSYPDPGGGSMGRHLNSPFPELRNAGEYVAYGLPETPDESDDTIRRHVSGDPRFLRHFPVSSLAWKAAQWTMADPPQDPATPRWINYYGPPDTVPYVSFAQVLSNEVSPSVLANQVVYVGARTTVGTTGGTGTDWFRHPGGGRITGTEVCATAYLNLYHGDWLRRLPRWAESLLVLAMGAGIAVALGRFRPLPALGWALGSAALITVLAHALVWFGGAWFPWLIVVAVQLPCAFLLAIVINPPRPATEPGVPPVASGPAPAPPLATVTATATVRAAPTLTPQLADHRLLASIGQGAYGEVWLAQNAIGLFHAVKLVFRKNFQSADPYEREFRGIKKYMPVSLRHAQLIHLLHVGRNDEAGYFYYVMELGDDETTGQTIDPARYAPRNLGKEIRQRGRLPVAECVDLGIDLAAALECLHQHQLVHRDLKPTNVIYVQGVPKIADIGLVTDLQTGESGVTYVGTHGYIAPEGPGSATADVYSLGKVLYEACMGLDRSRFPDLPSTLVAQPGDPLLLTFNRILLKACELDANQRYRSASELRGDLLALRAKLDTR